MSGREPADSAVQGTPLGKTAASVEEVLCEVFAEALGVTAVDPDDHFFHLGGHSLLVMRAAARIEARLGVRVPVSVIFRHPTVRALAPRLSTLEVVIQSASSVPEDEAAVEEPSALAPLQRGMWFLDQGIGRHAAYVLPDAWRLRGPLDAAALRTALHALVCRHTALSTRYLLVDGTPRQMVAAPTSFDLPVHDLRHLEPAARETSLSSLIAREADRPFDLEHDTLLRASLFALAEDEHVLLLTVHHLAADAWSQHVLRRELAELYRECRNDVRQMADRAPGRRDDAPRRARAVSDERREELRVYWHRQLEGLPSLNLPVDRRRPSHWSDAGGELVIDIDPLLTSRLEALASSSDVTLQMLLLAAYQVLLGRYAGQEDFGVASFASDRAVDAFDAIGLFVNTIVLRADLTGAPSFRSLLARVRQTSLDGYDHRDFPFDTLISELRPDRQAGPNPLTSVAFQYLPMPDEPPRFEGIEASRLPSPTGRVRFDLEFTIRKEGDRLSVLVGYSSDLWDRETIARLASCYTTVLRGVVAAPDASLADLPCLTEGERDEQLLSWSGLGGMPGRQGMVHELFASRASASPNRVAFESGDERVTYGELNARADRVAARLRSAGIGPGDVVAVRAGASARLVEAILGVLKARAAYLPLDDTYPVERSVFMLQHARAAAALTTAAAPDWLARTVPRVIDVSVSSGDLTTGARTDDPTPSTPDDLAYVMFTSGSTGRPKGVLVAHRGITRLVLDADYVDFREDDVVAFASNPAFDAVTFEVWGALLNGARLVEIDRQTLLSPALLAEAIRRHDITVMFVTAALFHQVAALAPDTFGRLRCLIAGGDVVDPVAAAAILKAAAPGRLVNGYGPTENTTFSCTFRITPDLSLERSIPIGRPITGSTCYVLGRQRELLPVGAVGELYVGGSGLSLGYVNDDGLTAERFVAHPFLESERLYRTGDQVRWRCNGQLEFLGRADRQVKLRGHRIELEEIEHVLSLHEAVSACALVLDKTRAGNPRLLAYVAMRNKEASLQALVDYLRRRLPAYMIPVAFVELPALPLTPNGKINRAALAAVRASEVMADALSIGAPETRMEALVAKSFREVLKLDLVKPQDNFFDLGGDSLASIRLSGQLTSATGRVVSVTDVFSHPTVAELANLMTRRDTATLPATLVEVRRGGARTPIYFPPGALGEVLVGSAISAALPEDLPLYAFRDPLDGPRVASMEEMASRFCADLTKVQPEGPVSLAGYSFAGLLAYEMARQLKASGREVRLLVIFDTGPDLSARGGVRDTLTRIRLCLQNLPVWILEDVVRSFDSGLPDRLWRSVKKQMRSGFTRSPSAAPGVVPKVDHLFDVTQWSPELYAHVENNLKILGAFQFRNYDGDVVLFRARARPLLHAHTWDLGWQSLTRSVRVVETPGNHHTLMLEPNIRVVAQRLRSVVEAAC